MPEINISRKEIKRQTGGSGFLGHLIDHNLTYGRDVIRNFLFKAAPYCNVVDLGAGSGIDLTIAKEINKDSVLTAIECGRVYSDNLTKKGFKVISINIEKNIFPFEDESVDIFIANQVIEHTKEIFWILHEISRCLKVGGHLILGVPNLASLHNRFLLLVGEHPTQLKCYSAHVRGFTRNDTIKFFKEVWDDGYCLRKFSGSQFYPFPNKIAKILPKFFPSMSFSIFFLLKKNKKYINEFLIYPIVKELETPFYIGQNSELYQYYVKQIL
ncbi:MAG: methyltransferase domain-containing protein [Desulfobacteraceae bacterium]|nr:methyltransferase domain-containing protein [Desulfobacteraceae bacterium]